MDESGREILIPTELADVIKEGFDKVNKRIDNCITAIGKHQQLIATVILTEEEARLTDRIEYFWLASKITRAQAHACTEELRSTCYTYLQKIRTGTESNAFQSSDQGKEALRLIAHRLLGPTMHRPRDYLNDYN